MPKSMFGWSLPAGCTHKMIDEALGIDQPCECCGRDPDGSSKETGCICPECPVCSSYGDPHCYEHHGLEYTEDQLEGQRELEAHYRRERERDDAMYAEWKKDQEMAGEIADSILDRRSDDKAEAEYERRKLKKKSGSDAETLDLDEFMTDPSDPNYDPKYPWRDD